LLLLVLGGLTCTVAQQPVPAVITVPSEIKRVVVIRLKANTDLLNGITEAVKKEKIKNGVILSGAGSLSSFNVHTVNNTTLPATLAYTKETGPYDLLAVTGYVLNGRVHPHITLVDTKKAFGGHLHEGTTVFTFAIATIGVLDDAADLNRFDDSSWR
jgi:hypothetical protein